jgi:hypothetical protein
MDGEEEDEEEGDEEEEEEEEGGDEDSSDNLDPELKALKQKAEAKWDKIFADIYGPESDEEEGEEDEEGAPDDEDLDTLGEEGGFSDAEDIDKEEAFDSEDEGKSAAHAVDAFNEADLLQKQLEEEESEQISKSLYLVFL